MKEYIEKLREAFINARDYLDNYPWTQYYEGQKVAYNSIIDTLESMLLNEDPLEWLDETAQQAPEPVEERRCFECGELLNKEALFCGECRKQI